MTKARTLGNFVSTGNPLSDGTIAAAEVTGLATVATSGSYNDLSNKPTITTTATNIAGGSNGTIPYQSASGTTQMLAAGTSGQLLQSNGAAAPSWATPTAVSLATGVTGTLPIANGGTGTTSTTFANLTTNVTGTLPIANGGTNTTATPTAGTVPYGTGTALAYTSAGTAGQVLTSAGSGAPTWQTASAAGSITAVASGTLANGTTVILNSDGTVSAVAATGAATITQLAQYAPSSGLTTASLDGNNIAGIYNSVQNLVVLFYIDSGTKYIYSNTLSVTGTSLTSIAGPTGIFYDYVYGGVENGINAVYDPVYDRCWLTCRTNTGTAMRLIWVSFNSSGIADTANTGFYSGTIYGPQLALGGNKLAVVGYQGGPATVHSWVLNNSTNGVVTQTSSQFNINSVGQAGYHRNTGLHIDPTGSYWTSAYAYTSGSRYVAVATGTINSSGVFSAGTSTQVAVASTTWTDNSNPTTLAYNTSQGKFTFNAFGGDTGSLYIGLMTATTGSSITVHQWTDTGITYNQRWVSFYYTSGNNSYVVGADSGASYGQAISYRIIISGTSFTLGSVIYPPLGMALAGGTVVPFNIEPYAALCYCGISTAYSRVTCAIGKAYTTNITATNFLGFSSASYTNGQTATINVVSGTDNNQTGLTAGKKYYVGVNGSLSSTANDSYAGLALSSTKLLIKG
jgi:hypothetical protein